METNKRRQIPTTNACKISASDAFAKRKISRFFIVFVSTSVTLRNYFRNADKLHTSQQRQPHTKHTNSLVHAHTRDSTMAAAGRAFSPVRAVPGIKLLSQLSVVSSSYVYIIRHTDATVIPARLRAVSV